MQPVAARHDQWLHHHGHPEIRFVAHAFAGESGRGHADHRERGAQHFDGRSQHGDIPAKTLLPVFITDDGIGVFSRTLGVRAVEKASDGRINAKHREIFFRNQPPLRVFLLASGNPYLRATHLRLRGAQPVQAGGMVTQLSELRKVSMPRSPLFIPEFTPDWFGSVSMSSPWGSRTGKDLSMAAFSTLKIAVLAPIPMASDATATAVKTGFRVNWRMA